MATFVLVHGAHAGGWWRDVRHPLRAAGHEVFTPSLAGHGERVHLASTDVTLGTHVRDVVNLLVDEELTGVALEARADQGTAKAAMTGAPRLPPPPAWPPAPGSAPTSPPRPTTLPRTGGLVSTADLALAAIGAGAVLLGGSGLSHGAIYRPRPIKDWRRSSTSSER